MTDEIDLWEQMPAGVLEVKKIEQAAQEVLDKSEIHFERPVLGKVLILNRKCAEQFTYSKPWACISIDGANTTFVADPKGHAILSEENRVDLLQLRFDDITMERDGWKPISDDQAKQVWEFVEKVWDKVDLLMIHCHAGLSRSTACGLVISEKYHPEYAHLYEVFYMPNILVKQTLRKAANMWPYDHTYYP